MNRWWTLCFVILPFVAWPQTDDLTYKGVPLGASIDEYKTKLPDHDCSLSTTSCMYLPSIHCFYLKDGKGDLMSGAQMQACRQRNTFGGVSVMSANSEFRDGKLVEVRFTISVTSFEILAGAAKERLGEPTKVVDRHVQTRAGATLQNREMIWERPNMVLTVERYGSTIDKGRAVLTTPQERDRKLAEYEARKKKGAKDF